MAGERVRQWTDDEPGLVRLRRELSRLKRRAIARPLRTLGLALLMAGAVVFLQARKPPVYSATILVSVQEGTLEDAVTPAPKRELRSYVAEVSFNKQHLKRIIEEYELYTGLYDIDPNLAVESMWDDLDVDVYQNYFLEESYDNSPRSARVAITYRAGEPQLAMSVARDLATLMIEFEVEKRSQQAAAAAEGLRTALEQAEDRLDAVATALAEKQILYQALPEGEQKAYEVELNRSSEELRSGQGRLEQLDRSLTNLELARAVEAERRGLRFRVVDEKKPQTRRRGLLFLVVLGVATFLLALPLSMVAVGAFDSRIYDGGDVSRLGVPLIGHVPGFGGDLIGGLGDRRAGDRRGAPGPPDSPAG